MLTLFTGQAIGSTKPTPPEYGLIAAGDIDITVEGMHPGFKFREPHYYGRQQHIKILKSADSLVFHV